MEEYSKILQKLWKENLELDNDPELTDSFFDLGGNSLQIARITEGFRELTGIELQVTDFYENETIGQLLEFIGK